MAKRRGRSVAAASGRKRGRPKTGDAAASMPFLPFVPPAPPVRGDTTGGEGAGAVPEVLCLPSPDWLKHRLVVTGPAADLAGFQERAAGPGIIPWRHAVADLAEVWFHRLVGMPVQERAIGIAGAHRLADRLRDAVETRWALTRDETRHAGACPLDLHALVPVPAAMLARGPDDPAARAWLWENWGTTWPLRHVTARGGPEAGRGGGGRIAFRFHAADWSPWAALRTIRLNWPALRFRLEPEYELPPATP